MDSTWTYQRHVVESSKLIVHGACSRATRFLCARREYCVIVDYEQEHYSNKWDSRQSYVTVFISAGIGTWSSSKDHKTMSARIQLSCRHSFKYVFVRRKEKPNYSHSQKWTVFILLSVTMRGTKNSGPCRSRRTFSLVTRLALNIENRDTVKLGSTIVYYQCFQ